jgi:hypothetical protein
MFYEVKDSRPALYDGNDRFAIFLTTGIVFFLRARDPDSHSELTRSGSALRFSGWTQISEIGCESKILFSGQTI